MSNEIVSLNVGQCGNQVAFEYLKDLCHEHNLDPNGISKNNNLEGIDSKDIFFHELDYNRFTPRSILVDTEPRVLNSIKNSQYARLFNPENIKQLADGGGAGNVWTKGFSHCKMMHEDLFEAIDHELDDCENLDGFFIWHSMAGGTGSGFGSRVLEDLADRYPKKLINTCSVVPNSEESSDTVVQPYNAVLTLSNLINYAHSVITIDNTALNRIAVENLRLADPDFTQINKFVSSAMCSLTAPIRFPRHSYTSYSSIMAGLVPVDPLHFLFCSYTPLGIQVNNYASSSKNSNVYDVMRRLLKPQNMLASISPNAILSKKQPDQKHKYISMLNILRGSSIDFSQINRSLTNIRDQSLVDFVTWTPACIQTCISYNPNDDEPKSPAPFESENKENIPGVQQSSFSPKSRITGAMISNHSSISKIFRKILTQFNQLKKSKAYLKNFLNDDFDDAGLEEALNSAKENVDNLIQTYHDATNDNFLDNL